MDTYTVSGLTEKEVKRLGESKWSYKNWKYLYLGLGIPIIVEVLLMVTLPDDFNKVGRWIFFAIPLIVYVYFGWVWIVKSTKEGKEFLKTIKEAK